VDRGEIAVRWQEVVAGTRKIVVRSRWSDPRERMIVVRVRTIDVRSRRFGLGFRTLIVR